MSSVAIEAVALAARFLTQVASLASRHGQFTVRAAFFLFPALALDQTCQIMLQSCRRIRGRFRLARARVFSSMVQGEEDALDADVPRGPGMRSCWSHKPSKIVFFVYGLKSLRELSPGGTPELSPGRQSWEHVQQFG